jgi:hypothetical protein
MHFKSLLLALVITFEIAAATPVSHQAETAPKALHHAIETLSQSKLRLDPGSDGLHHEPNQQASSSKATGSGSSSRDFIAPGPALDRLLEAKQRQQANWRKWHKAYRTRKKMGLIATGKRGRLSKQLDPTHPEYQRELKNQEKERRKYEKRKAKKSASVESPVAGPGKMLKELGFDLHKIDWTKLDEQHVTQSTAPETTPTSTMSTSPSHQFGQLGDQEFRTANSGSIVGQPSELDTLIEKQSWSDLAATAQRMRKTQ